MATVADNRGFDGRLTDEGASERTLAELLYWPLCLLSLLPFLLIAHPPITDFANHFARLWIACNGSDPAVAAMYEYRLGIIPNLALDLVNAPLCGMASPGAVIKGVTVGSLALLYVSGWLIQRKLFGRPNAFLLGLPALAFNVVTTMGYVNYLAGISLVCLMFALTLGRDERRMELLLIGNLGGVLIFFCHIFAFLAAMLLFFGRFLVAQPRSLWGAVNAALFTALMFAAPLLLMPLVAGEGAGFDFSYDSKPRLLPALFMTQHSGLGVNGLLLLFPLFWFMAKGRLALHPALRAPLMVLGAMILVIPSAMQNAVDVDARLAVVLAALFFAGLHPVRPWPVLERGIATVAGLVVGLNLWLAGTIWVAFDRQVTEFRAATGILPQHAVMLTVAEDDSRLRLAAPMAYAHLASYATIDRKIFNPLEFTGVGMQPMAARPRFLAVDTPAFSPLDLDLARRMMNPTPEFEAKVRRARADFALRWPETYDYVLFYHFGARTNFDPRLLTEVRRGSFFSILKVRRPASADRVAHVS